MNIFRKIRANYNYYAKARLKFKLDHSPSNHGEQALTSVPALKGIWTVVNNMLDGCSGKHAGTSSTEQGITLMAQHMIHSNNDRKRMAEALKPFAARARELNERSLDLNYIFIGYFNAEHYRKRIEEQRQLLDELSKVVDDADQRMKNFVFADPKEPLVK